MKNKVLAFCLAALLVVAAHSTVMSASGYPFYESLPGYQQLFDNISFTDISHSEAKKQIYKMSAFSIYRGMGSSAFSPASNITREQALFLVLRLVGLEEEAQKKGAALDKKLDTGGVVIMPSYDYWAMGAIEIAKKYKILTSEEEAAITTLGETTKENMDNDISRAVESYNESANYSARQVKNIETLLKQKLKNSYTWKQNVSKEQALVWLARAIKIPPVQDQSQQMIYTQKDWSSMEAASLPLIEALLQKGIVQKGSKGYFNPKNTIARGDMAKVLDAAFEATLPDRGYKVMTGTVIKVQDSVISVKGTYPGELLGQQLKAFTIKSTANQPSLINLTARFDESGAIQTGFILYKNGRVAPVHELRYGDTVKYYLDKNNKVVYVETIAE